MDTPSNNAPGTNNTPGGMAPMSTPPKNGSGPLVGIIIIVLVLAVGALYIWMKNQSVNTDGEPYGMTDQNESFADAITDALKNVGTSDTASAIEADLSATQTGNIDADLSQAGDQI